MQDRIKRTTDGGFVQIGALAGLAVVAASLALSLGGNMQLARDAAAFERRASAALIADSGVRRVLASIEDPADPLAMEVGVAGDLHTLELLGSPVELAIEGEAGKIDPLTAARPILESYFSNAGVPAARIAALMAGLDQARPAADAEAAFELLETYLLPDLTAENLARDFTDRSKLAGIDPLYASRRVLEALPDLGTTEIDEIIRVRSLEPGSLDTTASRYFAGGGAEFTIVAAVPLTGREALVRRVPIELTTAGRAVVLDGFR